MTLKLKVLVPFKNNRQRKIMNSFLEIESWITEVRRTNLYCSMGKKGIVPKLNRDMGYLIAGFIISHIFANAIVNI